MKTLTLFSLLIFIFSTNIFAISEVGYKENYQQKILPLIASMNDGSFIGKNNIKIHFKTLLQNEAKNCIVILPGRSEPVEKYAEIVFDLLQTEMGKNLNFYLMDHRGQGSSGRMAAISDLGYVDRFQNYVDDLETFINNQRLNDVCDKKFLLAHSMGGGIGVAYIIKNPHFFDKVALSSPMVKIQTKPFPYAVARAIVQTETCLGMGAKFASGQKGYDENLDFLKNDFTTSPERFEMTMSTFRNNPQTKLGGVANNWVLEVMKADHKMRTHFNEISVPMIVFNVGDERYISPKEIVRFCNEVQNCKRSYFPTAKHEILMERDVNRTPAIQEVINFFN